MKAAYATTTIVLRTGRVADQAGCPISLDVRFFGVSMNFSIVEIAVSELAPKSLLFSLLVLVVISM